MYVIRNTNNRWLFWSNDWGFGSFEGCERYSEADKRHSGLGYEMEWVELEQAKKELPLYPDPDGPLACG